MKRFMMSLTVAGALILSATPNQTAQAADDETIGTIIGAVGGGLLGSTLGKGKGRIVATAAGTIFGAVIGREIASDDDEYIRPKTRVIERERVVYRDPPRRDKVKHAKKRPYKKWKRVAAYDGEVLVCNKKGKRCHWYD
ncbi:glycine zipper 2TM domain-containing protein [Terasakiella sp. A23]|uniref:glycine zipper 2TM domain-containing protein n=1 Tax=Terasakiella sp. FCG-A23 TaxID=3080561 RepID=UPI0029550595|nr:glycine zipper 2TM domain-containing protein [Terasakiella sp. A23]MDV7338348.1 glycine zipper 2TM domain-containing protein [Terasakiella sp. A23]